MIRQKTAHLNNVRFAVLFVDPNFEISEFVWVHKPDLEQNGNCLWKADIRDAALQQESWLPLVAFLSGN